MTPTRGHLVNFSRLLCGCAIAGSWGLLAAGCGGDDGETKDSAEKPATTETSEATKTQGESTDQDKTTKSKKSPKAADIDPKTLKGGGGGTTKVPKKGIPASASPFVGLSRRRLSAEQVPAAAKVRGRGGTWTVVLGESAYSLTGPKGPVSAGLLKVSGGKMTFSPLPKPKPERGDKAKGRGRGSNPELCGGKRGTYRYVMKGREITFTKVSEECAARTVLVGGPWRNLSPRER